MDFAWIRVCNCVLRLKGESKGADAEVKYALESGIKVFYSIEEIQEYYSLKNLKSVEL